ncbi:hypothetical protein QP580_12825, partial [Prevotella bivia]|nr:hypothetical protein [Prevotella bivia]
MTTPEQAPADRAGTADAIPGRIRAREAARPGTWIAAVIVALIAAGLINFLITNPVFEWGIVVQYILDVKI